MLSAYERTLRKAPLAHYGLDGRFRKACGGDHIHAGSEAHRARRQKRGVRAGREPKFQPEHVAIEHRGLRHIAHGDRNLADVRHGVGQGSGGRAQGGVFRYFNQLID